MREPLSTPVVPGLRLPQLAAELQETEFIQDSKQPVNLQPGKALLVLEKLLDDSRTPALAKVEAAKVVLEYARESQGQ